MASSAPVETPPAVWAGLQRLRSISRLVLVAIEHEDDAGVRRLATEAETIIASLSALPPNQDGTPSHLHEALGDIRATNQRVVQALEERAAATREELTQVRETRLRLRSSRMPERTTTSSVLDREG